MIGEQFPHICAMRSRIRWSLHGRERWSERERKFQLKGRLVRMRRIRKLRRDGRLAGPRPGRISIIESGDFS